MMKVWLTHVFGQRFRGRTTENVGVMNKIG